MRPTAKFGRSIFMGNNMLNMDRRALLRNGSALLLATQLPRLAHADAAPEPPAGPPVARVEPVTETFFGVDVTDPYRWMENPQDPEWEPYMRGQADYTRAQLDRIPGLPAMQERVAQLSGGLELVGGIQIAGGKVFTSKRPAGANNFQIFVRDGMTGADRLLFDPESRTQGEVHYSLNYWLASPDGRYLILGVSPSGGEQAVMEIMDLETGTTLPERIDRAQYAGPSWLPDSSGFFLNRLAEGAAAGTTDFYKNSVCWLHKLNTDPSTDIKVLARGLHPEMDVSEIEFPGVTVQPGSDFVIGGLFAGVQNEITLYVNSLANAVEGKGGWQKICVPADQVTGFTHRGDDIWLVTYKDAPRYRVLHVKAQSPAISGAHEAVPQSDAVLQGVGAARDGIYLFDLNDGISGLRRLNDDGSVTAITMPFAGTLGASFLDPTMDGVVYDLQSWVRPGTVHVLDASGASAATTLSAPPADIDVSVFESVEVQARAADGVMVPLSIVYKKGTPRDGSNPTLIQAYGSYGINSNPAFIPRMIAFMERGGVWATAHVRGGGERGREWHEAGRLLTKPNTWNDLIACAEYMYTEGWSGSARIAIQGGSAGGITVGRAMTSRPDLFAVVISNVGVSNNLRAEFSQNGPPNIPEFGTVTTEDGFKGLYEMDSTVHVKAGTQYPAVLLTTGMTDPRVDPWQAGKMAAHLQAATASGKPVLLRVDFQAGHGIGSTRAQRDLEVADQFAFIFWQTGIEGFQPG